MERYVLFVNRSLHLWMFCNLLCYIKLSLCVLIGGREKAPAAFCRKALTSTDKFEMWGDGLQTRSFTFIDECVEGVLRLAIAGFVANLSEAHILFVEVSRCHAVGDRIDCSVSLSEKFL